MSAGSIVHHTNMQAPALLSARRLTKLFNGVPALLDVDLELSAGEIHALLGQNGSGKSTLIKVLAGYYAPERGASVDIDGRRLSTPIDPVEAHTRGLRFIHQDLALIDSLSILDNLSGGYYATTALGRIVPRLERRRAQQDLAAFGLELDPNRLVRDVSPVERAMIAIVRAARRDPNEDSGPAVRLMILDEPTSSLPRADAKKLFGFLQRLVRAEKAAVLIVTHRMREVFEYTDRVSVLRDGRLVERVLVEDADEASLVAAMVGRRVEIPAARSPAPRRHRGENVAVVRGISGAVVRGLDFEVHHGEVLGFTGLAGMGQDEIPYLLTGATRVYGGTIRIGDAVVQPRSPAEAAKAGIVLVPGDRQRQGSVPTATLRENITLPTIMRYWRNGFMRLRQERAAAQLLASRFEVVPLATEQQLKTFSGGNQQKAIFAKWAEAQARLIVLHQPTQGVDVASRQVLLGILRRWSAAGIGVVVCSVDHEEVAVACDRTLIMYDGQIRDQIEGPVATERLEVACQVVAPGARTPRGDVG
jgi:ribose transport system ATP-binding protein